jgi:hypothetical protein
MVVQGKEMIRHVLLLLASHTNSSNKLFSCNMFYL